MWFDIAVGWDAKRKRCDLVYAGGRLQIDTTPVTPMLVALGCDRRAEDDDTLPDGVTDASLAAGLNTRRGSIGDALGGGRAGSRLWLLLRSKLTPDVLADAEDYAAEALDPFAAREGVDLTVAASQPVRNVLLLRCALGGAVQSVQLRVAA